MITSKNTCIKHLPSIFTMIHDWKEGSVNLDIGGGKYDLGTMYLQDQYKATNLVYDPYNRTPEHNITVLEKVDKSNGVDTVTICNVLNVIQDTNDIQEVIKIAYDSLKDNGIAYIKIYEGDKSGMGKVSKKDCFQRNARTICYIPFLEQVFPKVIIKRIKDKSLIVAYKTK